MTRLLPEHPQGSSRDAAEQLVSVFWVSLGLLLGRLAVLLCLLSAGSAVPVDSAALVMSLCRQSSHSWNAMSCSLGDSR
jgi:hypothetical protein